MITTQIAKALINTEEAEAFGRIATPNDILKLKAYRHHLTKQGRVYSKEAASVLNKETRHQLYDQSMECFTRAQFCREAIETSEAD